MNKGTAIINGCKTNALIDTGSQVTTISKDFYDQHLTDCDIQLVETLKVVGAGGQNVPFLGYVSVNISFPEHEAGTYMRGNFTFALIVLNTTYNQRVPAVSGTNVQRHYASKYDHRNKTGGALQLGTVFIKPLRYMKTSAKDHLVSMQPLRKHKEKKPKHCKKRWTMSLQRAMTTWVALQKCSMRSN